MQNQSVKNAVDEQSVPERLAPVTHELTETDETVLFDENASELLVLSDSAAAIWYLIDGKRSVRDIAEFIEVEVASQRAPEGSGPQAPIPPSIQDAPSRELVSQVASFLEVLRERGVVALRGPEE